MSVQTGSPRSLERLVVRDHEVLRGLVDRFDTTGLADWSKVFREFFEYLVRHEVAEQEVLHPALRESVPGAGETIALCEGEEHALTVRLGVMEALLPDDPEFRENLGSLRDELASHLAHEEQVVIPMLRGLGGDDLEHLASSYEILRMSAPTEPTAVEPALATRLGAQGRPDGPLAGLAERLRDAVRRRGR